MEITRRTFLSGSIATGSLVFLAGCGGTEAGTSYTGPPRPGGILRIGALGRASGVTKDPYALLSNDSDMLIMSLILDPLTVPPAQAGRSNVAPRLASQWESDPAQRVWTFTIAENATFHDGSPVRAHDVVWSLRNLRGHPGGDWKVPVPAENITALSDRQVQLVSESPNSQLPLLLRLMTFTLKAEPDGQITTDITKAVGSGPFILDSYDDGNARLRRNPQWYRGAPLLDGIEVTRFDSAQALAGAITGNQIDVASNVGPLAARVAGQRSDLSVIRRSNDLAMCLALRTSDGPFADPRVREAIRLGVDRPAMVSQVLSGYGSVANDILGVGDPDYDRTIPQRARNIERARQLLNEARFDTSVSYPCVTKDEAAGEVDSARLLATQLADIGLKVNVNVEEVAAFYERSWTKAPMTTVTWATNDSTMFFAGKALRSGTSANETAFRDAEFDAACGKVLATPSGYVQQSALNTLQRIQYARGGYVAWGTADGIDIASARVKDAPQAAGYARVQLERTWLTP